MKILNLGCGTTTSEKTINVDWSMYLTMAKYKLPTSIVRLCLGTERAAKYQRIDKSIVVHNLTKKLPFEDESIDAVYHSHVLEHIDRDKTLQFLSDVRRVLVKDGIHRIVVPDFEVICRRYLAHVDQCEKDESLIPSHEEFISRIIEQMVRKEAFAAGRQYSLARVMENEILGDARARGETHQWMYDRFNLSQLLAESGFREIKLVTNQESSIPDWESYSLDSDEQGRERKRYSLYMEAVK